MSYYDFKYGYLNSFCGYFVLFYRQVHRANNGLDEAWDTESDMEDEVPNNESIQDPHSLSDFDWILDGAKKCIISWENKCKQN